jgi:endoglucanase
MAPTLRRRRGAAVRWLATVLASLLLVGCASPQTDLRPGQPLVSYAPLQHPFRGAALYHDADTAAASWQAQHAAEWLEPITSTPQARWVNGPQDVDDLSALAADAQRRRQLLVLVTYYIPNRGCTEHRDGAPTADAYQRWIDAVIARLGGTRSVVVMEPDAIPAECYDAARAATLARAAKALTDAGHYVYLDAGHPRWRSTGEAAERLIASGVSQVEGFAVNVANRQTTAEAERWGLELSDLVGDREFVIDTSRNGLGPPPDDPGRDDEWCNPGHQALGQPPTSAPARRGVAALLWIKRPGESDGECGGETTYLFTARQARTLIMNTTWVSDHVRKAARDADPTA